MMFIFRAVFWLAVISAVMPSRGDDTGARALDDAANGAAAAARLCADRPLTCLEGATAAATSVRATIPAHWMQSDVVPLPVPRPRSVLRASL